MSAILTNILPVLTGALPGMVSGVGGHDFNESLINGMFPTAGVRDITITPADDTDFTETIAGVAITVHSAVSGATAATIRDQFIAAILADARINTLVSPSANGALLRLTELQPYLPAVTFVEGAGLAGATVTAHVAETALQPGVFCSYGTPIANAMVDGRTARLVATGDAIANIAGVICRSHTAIEERYPPPSLASFRPGESMTVKKQGSIFVICETAMARNAAIHIRRIASGINTTIGAIRNAADGGNTIAMANGAHSTGTNFAVGSLNVAEIQINLPS